jgi:hypothetical protein
VNTLLKIEIPKRSRHCFRQGEPFLPGMEMYSLLFEDEMKKGVLRRDFCPECWNQVTTEEKPLNFRGYWKSKVEPPRKPPAESSRVARALTLLEEMLQAPEQKEQDIFVLCLFLARARQLALRHEFEKEGIAYQLYEILQREEFLTVKVFHLSPLEIETIQKFLACQLQTS